MRGPGPKWREKHGIAASPSALAATPLRRSALARFASCKGEFGSPTADLAVLFQGGNQEPRRVASPWWSRGLATESRGRAYRRASRGTDIALHPRSTRPIEPLPLLPRVQEISRRSSPPVSHPASHGAREASAREARRLGDRCRNCRRIQRDQLVHHGVPKRNRTYADRLSAERHVKAATFDKGSIARNHGDDDRRIRLCVAQIERGFNATNSYDGGDNLPFRLRQQLRAGQPHARPRCDIPAWHDEFQWAIRTRRHPAGRDGAQHRRSEPARRRHVVCRHCDVEHRNVGCGHRDIGWGHRDVSYGQRDCGIELHL